MTEILAPCNSLADLEPTPVSQTSTALTTPMTASKLKRKSRLSETDFTIIEKSMTLERKKTLMCTEHSSFRVLHKMKTNKLPNKKFAAMAPSEYEKHILNELNISFRAKEALKYDYPKELGEKRSEEERETGKRFRYKCGKTSVCSIF